MNDLVIVKKATVEAFGFTEKNETPEHAIIRAKSYYEKDLETYKSHLINYPDMAEHWRNRIEATEKTLAAGFEVVTFEEFLALQKKYLCDGELTEITKEDFDEHFNMLPPLKWCNRHNVEMFCMSEMYTGTYTTQYAYSLVTGKYYCAMVDVTDPETWIDKILDKAA